MNKSYLEQSFLYCLAPPITELQNYRTKSFQSKSLIQWGFENRIVRYSSHSNTRLFNFRFSNGQSILNWTNSSGFGMHSKFGRICPVFKCISDQSHLKTGHICPVFECILNSDHSASGLKSTIRNPDLSGKTV